MELSRTISDLAEVERKLCRWRTECGGRGQRIPDELWVEATEVAAAVGVRETARALRLDAQRLGRRVEARSRVGSQATAPTRGMRVHAGFVEVDAQRVFARSKTVIRLMSQDGEQLEVEVEGGALEVAQVARALWGRTA